MIHHKTTAALFLIHSWLLQLPEGLLQRIAFKLKSELLSILWLDDAIFEKFIFQFSLYIKSLICTSNKHWTEAWLGKSPLVCCCKASQGCWSSHAENDGVPHKQRPINGPWPVSQALGTDLSHENETSVLWVTCPKSVIGVTSHGSYTSLALLFLANLQCFSWSGGNSSLPIDSSLPKYSLFRINVFCVVVFSTLSFRQISKSECMLTWETM